MQALESVVTVAASAVSIARDLGLLGPLGVALVWFLASTWVFYVLYMVYAGYMVAVRSGARVRRLTRWMLYPVVLAGYLLDVVWNCTFGSLLFFEWPWAADGRSLASALTRENHPLKWTFTRRLRSHYYDNPTSWRTKQAAWWATYLNPFDPGHV